MIQITEPIRLQRIYKIIEAEINPLVDISSGEGHNHIRRLKEEYFEGINKFECDGEALYGAYHGSTLIGVCGLNQDPHSDLTAVGRVRRLYILPEYRRKGIARQLTMTIIQEAKQSFKTLILRTDNPEADKFYQAIGFSSHEQEHFTHMMKFEEDSI